MNIPIVYFLVFLPIAILPTNDEDVFFYGRLKIAGKPVSSPKAVPREFYPEKSKILYSTELKGRFSEIIEAFSLIRHEMPLKDLVSYYENLIKIIEWRVMQKEEKDGVTIIFAEGPQRKSVAFLINDSGDFRQIKLLYKKTPVFDR